MKNGLLILLNCFFNLSTAKEYKNLKAYEKLTDKLQLESSDWFYSDRKNNTAVWQQANLYYLQNNLPIEYQSLKERTDFYS